jgi:hypothetical protein
MALFDSVTKYASKAVTSVVKKQLGSTFDLLNPANARRAISGLFAGGGNGQGKAEPNIGFNNGSESGGASAANENDWRVRISLADNSQLFYKNSGTSSTQNQIMSPLAETNGVIWPYLPTITVTHTAGYTSTPLTHSNYPAVSYNGSEVADITISGEFTVQSAEEGQYLLAAIYFFRSATKMFFGTGENVGNPPPMVFLDGYGSHYFPHVPGVITSFTHTMSSDVDYVEVPVSVSKLEETLVPADDPNIGKVNDSLGERIAPNFGSKKAEIDSNGMVKKSSFSQINSVTRVPTVSTLSISFRPMYSRKNLHDRFDLNKFASGELIQDKDKGYGGYI